MLVLCLLLTAALVGLGAAITQSFSCGWAGGAAEPVSSVATLVGTIEEGVEVTLAAGTVTDQEIQIGFDVTTVKGVIITVTDNPATTVVLESNNAGTPIHTLTFPAGGGQLFWTNQFPAEILNPFKVLSTTDVLTLFATKSGADTPTIRIRYLK